MYASSRPGDKNGNAGLSRRLPSSHSHAEPKPVKINDEGTVKRGRNGHGKSVSAPTAGFPDPKLGLNFAVIRDDLDSLLASTANKIHREPPAALSNVAGAREFLLTTVKMVDNTYRTIRFICADTPKDPDRKSSYAISVPPLNRTILDSLFTVVFMLENLASRCHWYQKAGWRALSEELNRYKREYGYLPEWQTWLDALAKLVRDGISIYGITPQEVANPGSIDLWPNPGKMPHYGVPERDELALKPAQIDRVHIGQR